jgi:hypothetical protein
MSDISFSERLNRIKDEISKPDFLKNKGLGNEVGYYIFDYEPQKELVVRDYIMMLKKQIPNIIEFDLYEIVIKFLEDNGYLEDAFIMEEDGIDNLISELQPTLGLTEDGESNKIIDYIVSNTYEDSIVFITGVGKVYPLVRSHTILNNLHQKMYKVPVIMFFPGEYTGQNLKLFNDITDDNYYRAFPLCK